MTMKTLITFSLSLMAHLCWAVPEQDVPKLLQTEIIPWAKSTLIKGSIKGAHHINLVYHKLPASTQPAPKGVMVFVNGKGDSGLKYLEFLYDIKDWGYDVFVLDHRGQGESDRLWKTIKKDEVENQQDPRRLNPLKNHVEDFQNYVADLETFIDTVVKPQEYNKAVLLAHSMGGAISSGYLMKHPKTFQRVVMLAPLFKINTLMNVPVINVKVDLEKVFLADLSTYWNHIRGQDEEYKSGQHTSYPFDPFSEKSNAGSENRHEMKKTLARIYPQTQLAGITNGWLYTTLRYTQMLRKQKNIFQVPTLIYQAGADTLVMSEGQDKACAHSPDLCQVLREYLQARHEFLFEKDAIRNPVMAQVRAFFDQDIILNP